MGLLSLGTPLDWHESKKFNEHVRQNGIIQLINIFKQHQARSNDHFFWGDEVEYMLVDIDDKNKTANLSIDQDWILDVLNDEASDSFKEATAHNVCFHPEYGRYMVEATPLEPYDGESLGDLLHTETNMISRRVVSQKNLPAHIRPLTLTSFPRMGCGVFTSPPAKPIGPASQSMFLPDEIINRHARFPTLTANIRKRRGCKVAINLPVYPDKFTKLVDDTIPDRELFESDKEAGLGAALPGHVYMDSMGFGMGASCLQMTMQLKDIDQARQLYDLLAPLTPILLSLSAAAPIFRGYLVNQDVRWNVISGAVDDRTFLEKNIAPYKGYDIFGGLDVDRETKEHISNLGGGPGVNGDRITNEYGDTNLSTKDGKPLQKVPKSRYESIDSYLSKGSEKFNDIYSPINSKVYDQLIDTNLFDPVLARHFAHLFIRDPLVIFSERVDQDNELENDHFENIQSTNWQTLRFKPPSLYPQGKELSSTPGWRVEFRPVEIQLTDFENSAYTVFLILVSKALLKFAPDLYIPISKIDENMKTAHKVDSVLEDKFWFKSFEKWGLDSADFAGYDFSWFDRYITEGNDILLSNGGVYVNGYADQPVATSPSTNGVSKPSDSGVCRYTANEIINGNDNFPGLIKLVIRLIATELVPRNAPHCESSVLRAKVERLQAYLLLISKRASGKLPTIAHWLRHKAVSSPHYQHDSKVSESLNYELIKLSDAVTQLDFANHRALLYEYFGQTIGSYLEKNRVLVVNKV